MKLTRYHVEDLRAVQRRDVSITSEGFVFDGLPVDEPQRERLDWLWMDDYIDGHQGMQEPATVVLTAKGEQELARAEQESQR